MSSRPNCKKNKFIRAFDSLEMDVISHDEIKSQNRVKEIVELIQPVMKQNKIELQGTREHKLVTDDVNVEEIFGSLKCLNHDVKK